MTRTLMPKVLIISHVSTPNAHMLASVPLTSGLKMVIHDNHDENRHGALSSGLVFLTHIVLFQCFMGSYSGHDS